MLTAAFQLGLADRLTELAVAYAKERVQFDRPIGAFQAIKHLLADMLVRTEVARAAVYSAGRARSTRTPSARRVDRLVHGAKVVAGEAAIANGKTATQVHGGMGFTWEVDVHLYLKRAWVLDTHFEQRRPQRGNRLRRRRRPRLSAHGLTLLSWSMTRPQTTVLEALAERLASDPDGPYLDFSNGGDSVQFTAREMDRESNRLAHTLRELGVGHGDRVATLLENRAEQVVSFFAALKLGAIQVPINTAYKGEFLRHQLADSRRQGVRRAGRLRVARGRGRRRRDHARR